MTNVSSVNFSEITDMVAAINAQRAELETIIGNAKQDFSDDRLFNASSAGSSIADAKVTMEDVQQMSYNQIQELLNTPTDAQINAEMERAEEKLNEYINQFEKLTAEIETLEKELNALQTKLEKAQNDKAEAESALSLANKNKAKAELEVEEAQAEYEKAKNAQAKALNDAENQAYEDAMKEFEQQEANEELKDNEKKSFESILSEKRNDAKISGSYDTAISDAAKTLASKKALVRKFENTIIKQTNIINEKTTEIANTQNAINQKNIQLNAKQTELTTVSSNITKTQTTVNNLETQMATRKFINENQTAIDDIAYEKNPETIQARADIANAETTVAEQLAKVQNAEKAAASASVRGDKETAEAKKKEAEDAKRAADEAKAKAEAAKAKLRDTDAAVSKLNNINNNAAAVTSSYNKTVESFNTAKAKADAVQAARDASVTYSSYVDEEGNTVYDKTKLDLTKMIDPKELELVTKFGLDLSACVEKDGKYYPAFIIAKGQHDGLFHIYQRMDSVDTSKTYEKNARANDKKGMASWKNEYFAMDIARLYGQDGGFDICVKGNGYMKKQGDCEYSQNGYNEVYYITTQNCTEGEDLKDACFGVTYKKYTTNSPLSLDLNGDGVKVSDKVVDFDIDGDGEIDRINDSSDAVLCFDKDGNGVSGKDGSECFGNNTDLDGDGNADGYKDGFEALKALAEREGLINNDDDMVLDEKDIKFLELNFGFKIKANGYNSEAKSLSEYGISAINLAKTNETKVNNIENGNQMMRQEGATFVQDGVLKEYADIWHRKLDFDENPFTKIA